MKHDPGASSQRFSSTAGWLLLFAAPACFAAAPSAAATVAFNSYIDTVEARLAQEHASANGFLAPEDSVRLRKGDLIVEELTPAGGKELDGALLHDWRGTAFAPGATGADFERLMKDYADYPRAFSPQVMQARVLAQQGDHFQTTMRVKQKHIITVVMDSTYDVMFARLDAQHGYSISHSTRVTEIDAPGTTHERALGPNEEHGFLWRMNTYWSYEERDGGLYIQIESITLTRSVPAGLGWVIDPFIQSIPRDSLEFTLHSACNALRR
jgi:hypothetical protein